MLNRESIIFDTVPSHFLGLHFKSVEPHREVRTMWRNGEASKITGFNPNISELPTSSIEFDIPTLTVNAIISYLNTGFGQSHVRNCHDFIAHIGGHVPRNNYREATKTLNQHIFDQSLSVDDIQAGDLVAIAHPGFFFRDFGALQIDHSCLALGDGQALEISGLGGALAINSLERTLLNARKIMTQSDQSVWLDKLRPTSNDIGLYKIPNLAKNDVPTTENHEITDTETAPRTSYQRSSIQH